MKYLLPFLILLFLGCKADNDSAFQPIEHAIIGKWQLEATKISPGGIVDWSEVNADVIYEFKPNGVLELGSWGDCKGPISGTFSIKDDKLYLKYTCNSEIFELGYYIWFEEDKLILGFIGCIEACSYRFFTLN